MFSTISLPLAVLCLIIGFAYLLFPHIGFHRAGSWSSYHRVFVGKNHLYAASTMFAIGMLPFIFQTLVESRYYPQFAVASIFVVNWLFTTSKPK